MIYGEDRLLNLLNDCREKQPDKLAENVWEQVRQFQGRADQFDDITILAVNYHGEVSGQEPHPKCYVNRGPADLSRMLEIQTFLEESLENAKVPKKYIRQLLIASDEITSNVCKYSKAKEVTIDCLVDKEEILVFFEDDGIEFNPLKKEKPDINEPIEQRKIGGLGIYMVCEMMDKVTYAYKHGKNRLTIKKYME